MLVLQDRNINIYVHIDTSFIMTECGENVVRNKTSLIMNYWRC